MLWELPLNGLFCYWDICFLFQFQRLTTNLKLVCLEGADPVCGGRPGGESIEELRELGRVVVPKGVVVGQDTCVQHLSCNRLGDPQFQGKVQIRTIVQVEVKVAAHVENRIGI